MKTLSFCLFAISGLIFPSFAHADIRPSDPFGWEKSRRAAAEAAEAAEKECGPGWEEIRCGFGIGSVGSCAPYESDTHYYLVESGYVKLGKMRPNFSKFCRRTPEALVRAMKEVRWELLKNMMKKFGILAGIGLGGYLIWRIRRRKSAASLAGGPGPGEDMKNKGVS